MVHQQGEARSRDAGRPSSAAFASASGSSGVGGEGGSSLGQGGVFPGSQAGGLPLQGQTIGPASPGNLPTSSGLAGQGQFSGIQAGVRLGSGGVPGSPSLMMSSQPVLKPENGMVGMQPGGAQQGLMMGAGGSSMMSNGAPVMLRNSRDWQPGQSPSMLNVRLVPC